MLNKKNVEIFEKALIQTLGYRFAVFQKGAYKKLWRDSVWGARRRVL